MSSLFKSLFYMVQISFLVWAINVLSSVFAKADNVKLFPQKIVVENQFYDEPVVLAFRHPSIGLNQYFIKSLTVIRNEELQALEEKILNTEVQKFNDQVVELPLEQPHLIGLNGYMHHSTSNQREFNLIHFNFK